MKTLVSSALILTFASVSANANEYAEALTELAENELMSWLENPEITSAITAQNAAHAGMTQDEIDSLDKTWRAEVGAASSPLIDEVMARQASLLLQSLQDELGGVVTEVFVMDNLGLNAAQSAVTSDYWQGDEDKWQKTYKMGAGAIHFGDVEFDESTQAYQTQLSLSIVEPSTNEVIGAATFGVDVDALE